ncbi:MAG: ankyrin repeat domain-containing protein [Longimicrobiales bacterium]
MESHRLPPSPDLDHLRRQAKALMRACLAGDADAMRRVRAVLPDAPARLRLADAQLVIAREYGFASWSRLKLHIETSRGVGAAVAAFLEAVADGRADTAREIAANEPRVVSSSVHVAAILGRDDELRRLLAEDPERVRKRAGPHAADPLLALCFSPFHGDAPERDDGLLRATFTLLQAGADPNTSATFREGREEYGIPALYAVTGVHDAPRIARALLEAGARPNDGESLFHAAQHFHRASLEVLLEYGADPNEAGTWGNTPLYFLLDHYDEGADDVRRGIDWLLEHGADPDVVCGTGRETALHVAIRRGRSPEIVRLLLDRGADVHARRGDGRTPWRLARRGGNDELVAVLENAGAVAEPLPPADALFAACGRGDAGAARALATPALIASLAEEDLKLLPHAAAEGRPDVVRACLAAGFAVNQEGDYGGTALHHACIRGSTAIVREVLRYAPDLALRDATHDSSPLGWATFGADVVREPGGDYVGCVEALIGAGAALLPADHRPDEPAIAALLTRFMHDSPRASSD